jgi:hypothetical protein
MRTVHQIVVSVLIRSLQPEAEHGFPWACMARSLPRPLPVLCCLVRRRMFGLGCGNYDRTHPKGYHAAAGYRTAVGCRENGADEAVGCTDDT